MIILSARQSRSFEHDETMLLALQKSLLLHELLAVKRPAFVENRGFIHQAWQSRSCRNRIGHRKLQVVSGITFMHRRVFQADPVVFAQQIVVVDWRHVIVADLIRVFGRGREVGGERNLVAAKLRRGHDVEFFLRREGDEVFFSDEMARRFHRSLISRKNRVDRRMVLLDRARHFLDILSRREFAAELGQFPSSFCEQRFTQGQQALGVVL